MQSLLLHISSNTNQFVDLKCKSFRKLLVANSDSEDITINLVVGKDDTAQDKKKNMKACRNHIVDSPAEIGKKVAEVLKNV